MSLPWRQNLDENYKMVNMGGDLSDKPAVSWALPAAHHSVHPSGQVKCKFIHFHTKQF